MKLLEDPDIKALKQLIRYGENNESFSIMKPRSHLYTMIVKKSKRLLKGNLLCIVDDKSVRINSIYKNTEHKEELQKWAERIGKISLEYKASNLDLESMKNSTRSVANWRLNKRPGNVTPDKDIPFTEALLAQSIYYESMEVPMIPQPQRRGLREYMGLLF